MNKTLKYIIGALVIVALFLGYKIQQKDKSVLSVNSSPVVNKDVSASSTGSVDVFEMMRKDSSASSTAESRQKYYAVIQSEAVKSDTLTVTSCSPMPSVISLKQGSSFSLVNKDKTPHTIVFTKDQFFTVEGNSSKTMKADFGHGQGIYGYGCDKSASAVGLIVVTP